MSISKDLIDSYYSTKFENKLYKPLPVNKNGPEHLPSIWNEVG